MPEAWRNWSRELSCTPAAIERPRTAAELGAVVARAATAGQRVRVSASGHSFSEIALTDGVMVRLDHLDRLLGVDVERGLVRVEAGIVLAELSRRLDSLGLGLENLGDIDRQTLGGAIATATHGTGSRYRNLSSQVEALELVGADGTLLELSERSDPGAFRAARVGLGSLGIVYSVTLRALPAFTLRRVDRPRPLEEVLADLDSIEADCDHFEFYVFPHTGTALCRETVRLGDAAPQPCNRATEWAREVALENGAGAALAAVARRFPGRAPALARLGSAGFGRSTKIDRSHRVFASDRRVRFTEMEYSIPREAMVSTLREVLAVAARPRHAVAFPIEVRFVAADNALLSPSFERDACYVAVHHDRALGWSGYFREVEAAMRERDGRPHWGKRHFREAADLAPLYPRWEDFAAVRERLDPGRVFSNAYIDRVLG
ncbi:MAG: FAD-binding protein [Solirubrobacterales bacterium]|nr:FAD-binding protein [Solirubrobacterales bacterium]